PTPNAPRPRPPPPPSSSPPDPPTRPTLDSGPPGRPCSPTSSPSTPPPLPMLGYGAPRSTPFGTKHAGVTIDPLAISPSGFRPLGRRCSAPSTPIRSPPPTGSAPCCAPLGTTPPRSRYTGALSTRGA